MQMAQSSTIARLTRVKMTWFIVCSSLILHSPLSLSDDLFDMELEELLNIEITSASLTRKSQRLSPSTVSSTSGEELRLMGARTLSQALRLLPGIDVQERRNGRDMVWIRGIPSGRNTKVMLLVDGVPHREPVFGGWSPDEEVPLNNIQRIEVIRGPGSALYGGNAYSGLISIFTKKAVDETRVSLSGGSFDSRRAQLETGGDFSEGNWILASSLYKTQGHKMKRDRRGLETDHHNEVFSYSGHLKVNWRNFTAAINSNHYNTEYPLYSLRQTKPQDYHIVSTYLSHQAEGEDFTWFNQVYYYHVSREMDRRRWDESGTLFFQSFSDLNTDLYGATSRVSTQWQAHHIMVGAVIEALNVNDYSEVIHLQNYQVTNELQSVLDDEGNQAPDSQNYAFFVQDDINFWQDKGTLTASLRYDKYREFPAEVSPRLGLVVQASQDWTFKLMWGEAFRPPSNLQQYEVRSDGNVPGNPNVKPEKIASTELEATYRLSATNNLSLRLFNNELSDFIASMNAQAYQNSKETESVDGVELEYKSQLDEFIGLSNMQINANITLLNTDRASVAKRMANFQALSQTSWGNLSLALRYMGRRNASDSYHDRVLAEDVLNSDHKKPYVTVDMHTVIIPEPSLPIEINVSAFNLFDTTYYNPTYAPDSYYDVTREPRYLSVGISYKF